MSAPEPFGPADPYKYARQSGRLIIAAVTAANLLQHGYVNEALSRLRTEIEEVDPVYAAILWPQEKVA